jgi:hypothetical protein
LRLEFKQNPTIDTHNDLRGRFVMSNSAKVPSFILCLIFHGTVSGSSWVLQPMPKDIGNPPTFLGIPAIAETKADQTVTITGPRQLTGQTLLLTDFVPVLHSHLGAGDALAGGASSSSANTAKPTSIANSEIDCSSTSGNPVVIATGEKVKAETDFMSNGLYAFGVTRTYRSSRTSASALFGPNWPSSLDGKRLTWSTANCQPGDGPYCYPRSAILTEANGAKYEYKQPLNTDGYPASTTRPRRG